MAQSPLRQRPSSSAMMAPSQPSSPRSLKAWDALLFKLAVDLGIDDANNNNDNVDRSPAWETVRQEVHAHFSDRIADLSVDLLGEYYCCSSTRAPNPKKAVDESIAFIESVLALPYPYSGDALARGGTLRAYGDVLFGHLIRNNPAA